MTFFALGWEEECILLDVDLTFAPLSLALDGSCHCRERGPLFVRWYHSVQDGALCTGLEGHDM